MNENEISVAEVQYNKDSISIVLPKEIAKYLNIGPKSKNKTVFYSLTNKVLQVSGGKPILDTPLLNEYNFDFASAS